MIGNFILKSDNHFLQILPVWFMLFFVIANDEKSYENSAIKEQTLSKRSSRTRTTDSCTRQPNIGKSRLATVSSSLVSIIWHHVKTRFLFPLLRITTLWIAETSKRVRGLVRSFHYAANAINWTTPLMRSLELRRQCDHLNYAAIAITWTK